MSCQQIARQDHNLIIANTSLKNVTKLHL